MIKNVLNTIKIYIKNLLLRSKHHKIPFFKGLLLKIRGFKPEAYVQYDFKTYNKNEFITNVQRWKSRRINGKGNEILDNKSLFYENFNSFVEIPKTILIAKNGNVFDLEGRILNEEEIILVFKNYPKTIFKPNNGAGGINVLLFEFKNNNFYINSNLVNNDDFFNVIKTYAEYILTEFVEQHEYARNLYEHTTNTIRIVTTKLKNDGVIIPLAMHRVGTSKTVPVDNASFGGLFSMIDVKTGVLSVAKSYTTSSNYLLHPESNNNISGVVVPRWEEIKNEILKVANSFKEIPFMSWDIVVTNNSFVVLEINGSTGLDFIQMFEPQKNKALGIFFKERGIIK
ncbi:MAG TPA: hypothetical protein GX695_02110 [Acholeplasmataceae bacterium]|nr:hypothetical protein [Acholeplasmataceae bacterium]